MPFVPDSTQPGYLGPTSVGQAEGSAFEDWLHDVFAGITGLPDTMVRPSWQWQPAPRPDPNIDWLAFGWNTKTSDFTPAIIHFDKDDGYDFLQEHEIVDVICTFYGPNVDFNVNLLRRGLFIDQNRASFRKAGVGLIETSEGRFTPEVFNARWWSRGDINVSLRREVRLIYPILNLVRARGLFYANDPAGVDILRTDWDTGRVLTRWDKHNPEETKWDDGTTLWDVPP
jgi:hypothetical protein